MFAYAENRYHERIIFLTLLTLMIPSIFCSIYLFYQFVRIRILRRRISNHLVLLLLITNFMQVTTELPFNLHLLNTGVVPISTTSFCIFWNIYNFVLVAIGLFALAYGCIERYLLIFARTFFEKHRICLHYIPFSFCIGYPIVFYVYVVAFYSCEHNFTYNRSLCGRPCYEYERFLGSFDWIGNLSATVAVAICANLFLLIRVIERKRRVVQRGLWRRNRRLILQLLSVSILYFIVWVPILFCFLMMLFTSNIVVLTLSVSYLNYYQYTGMLLYPFICLIGLKEVQDALKQQIQWLKRQSIKIHQIQPLNRSQLQAQPPLTF